MLESAAEQFGGKDETEIKEICLTTLEGHQRAIMGNMSVEQIYRDRQTFSTKVFEVASQDLYALGIQVISYTIKGINDEVDYLHSLGQTRTAQVKSYFVKDKKNIKKHRPDTGEERRPHW